MFHQDRVIIILYQEIIFLFIRIIYINDILGLMINQNSKTSNWIYYEGQFDDKSFPTEKGKALYKHGKFYDGIIKS
jgi:hypothetical protein